MLGVQASSLAPTPQPATRTRNITAVQVGLVVVVLMLLASLILAVAPLLEGQGITLVAIVALSGIPVYGLVLLGYLRNWRYAGHVLVISIALLTGLGVPLEYAGFSSSAFLVAPILALILLDKWWMLGSTGLLHILMFARLMLSEQVPGSIYTQADALSMLLICTAGLFLSGLITEGAYVTALSNAQRADEQRLRAEAQSQELETANEQLNQQLEQQRRLLDLVATLETPAIILAEGVLFAPIIGYLDSRRAQDLRTRLLEETHRQRARMIILDIAGVSTVDTMVARALTDTVRALRLLGCQVSISGISAPVAMTLTHLGITLEGVPTLRSPQEALTQFLAAAPARHETTRRNGSN